MKLRVVFIILLMALLVPVAVSPANAAPAASFAPQKISPASFLNPNGTLNLNGDLSGSLDLSGYHVRLDPQRGPVFDLSSPQAPAAPAGVTRGQWAGLGGGVQSLNNIVLAITVSGSNAYIGGRFTDANGILTADYIVMWNGTSFSALGSNGAGDGALNNYVYAIAVSGSKVYVGGLFTQVNNQGAVVAGTRYIAQWDGANWSALSGAAGTGPFNNIVLTICVSASDVYIGGDFTDANGNPEADYITYWTPSSGAWAALGNDGEGNGSLTGRVNSIVMNGATLYAGGTFTDVRNGLTVLTAADYIARWNGSSWFAMGSTAGGQGVFNNIVYTLALDAYGSLYAGGDFTAVVSGSLAIPGAAYIARWDGNWHGLGYGLSGSAPALNGGVRAIYVSGSNIYVGGFFYDIENYGISLPGADYIARWDGANWSSLGTGNGLEGALWKNVYAIGAIASMLYIGGHFTIFYNKGTMLSAQYLATFDGADWSSPPAAAPVGALNDIVRAVAVSGTDVYVGGDFTDLFDGSTRITAADYIAKWDGAHWSAVGDNGSGEGALGGYVDALAVSGSTVYAGGDFTYVVNHGNYLDNASYIAKWDGANWSGLGDDGSGGPSLNSYVYAIAVSGANVYAGGDFTNVNNKGTVWDSADYIARWDGSNWYPLLGDGAGNGSLNDDVLTLAVSGSNLYVGGYFKDVNNGGNVLGAADYVAKWDGSNWAALGYGSSAGVGALNATVRALAVSGATLYVGGEFTNVNNQGALLSAADYIARWDGTHWSALGHDPSGDGVIHPGINPPQIDSIVVSNANVYIGGYFQEIYNDTTSLPAAVDIARWDGSNWWALGSDPVNSSLNSDVLALALSGPTLYAGGLFTDVNNGGSVLPAADYFAAYGTGPRQIFLPFIKR